MNLHGGAIIIEKLNTISEDKGFFLIQNKRNKKQKSHK